MRLLRLPFRLRQIRAGSRGGGEGGRLALSLSLLYAILVRSNIRVHFVWMYACVIRATCSHAKNRMCIYPFIRLCLMYRDGGKPGRALAYNNWIASRYILKDDSKVR